MLAAECVLGQSPQSELQFGGGQAVAGLCISVLDMMKVAAVIYMVVRVNQVTPHLKQPLLKEWFHRDNAMEDVWLVSRYFG